MSPDQSSALQSVRGLACTSFRRRLIYAAAAACLCFTLFVSVQQFSYLKSIVAQHDEVAITGYHVDRTTEEGRTFMQCVGNRMLTRVCHFANVYYNVESKRFIFFGVDGITPEMFGGTMREILDGEPWLKMIRGETKWSQPQEKPQQFYMEWRSGEELPAQEDVAVYTKPVHLRTPHFTYSFGHLLRDNLQYLVDLPIRFGRDPVTFEWVRWMGEFDIQEWDEEHETAIHYRGLYNNRPSLTWQEVMDQALSGMPAGVQYIRLHELIAGSGVTDMESQMGQMGVDPPPHVVASWAHMCKPFPFAAMRQVAYRNHGLQVKSVAELNPFILFLNGQADEKRHIANVEELVPKLRLSFPGVRIEHSEISAHPLQVQLELISQATILVSNIGSRSFRLVYLPDGATTILIGPIEFAFMMPPREDGQPDVRETIDVPFQEIDWCWGFIGYVNMMQYHVTNETEVIRGKERWRSWLAARNADIALDEEKITTLLRAALKRSGIQRMQHERALNA